MKRQVFGTAVALLLSSGFALAADMDAKTHHLVLISYLSAGDGPLLASPTTVTKMDGVFASLDACKKAASAGAQRVADINNPGGKAFGNLAAFLFCVPAQ